MALDLEEQEQLDALKQFWKQYGALIITLAFLDRLRMEWRQWSD